MPDATPRCYSYDAMDLDVWKDTCVSARNIRLQLWNVQNAIINQIEGHINRFHFIENWLRYNLDLARLGASTVEWETYDCFAMDIPCWVHMYSISLKFQIVIHFRTHKLVSCLVVVNIIWICTYVMYVLFLSTLWLFDRNQKIIQKT